MRRTLGEGLEVMLQGSPFAPRPSGSDDELLAPEVGSNLVQILCYGTGVVFCFSVSAFLLFPLYSPREIRKYLYACSCMS